MLIGVLISRITLHASDKALPLHAEKLAIVVVKCCTATQDPPQEAAGFSDRSVLTIRPTIPSQCSTLVPHPSVSLTSSIIVRALKLQSCVEGYSTRVEAVTEVRI